MEIYEYGLNKTLKYLNNLNPECGYHINGNVVFDKDDEVRGYIEIVFMSDERLFTTDDYWNFNANYAFKKNIVIEEKIKSIQSELESVIINNEVEEFIEEIKDLIY